MPGPLLPTMLIVTGGPPGRLGLGGAVPRRGGRQGTGGAVGRAESPERTGAGSGPCPAGGPERPQAFGATFDSPLMMRSIASPPVGSVRLASILSVNFIRSGWVRPRWVATFMTFGLPISFTKARPIV